MISSNLHKDSFLDEYDQDNFEEFGEEFLDNNPGILNTK